MSLYFYTVNLTQVCPLFKLIKGQLFSWWLYPTSSSPTSVSCLPVQAIILWSACGLSGAKQRTQNVRVLITKPLLRSKQCCLVPNHPQAHVTCVFIEGHGSCLPGRGNQFWVLRTVSHMMSGNMSGLWAQARALPCAGLIMHLQGCSQGRLVSRLHTFSIYTITNLDLSI